LATAAEVSQGATGAAQAGTVRWRIFGIVFLLVVVNLVDRIALSIAMPSIAKEFALSPASQGVILSAFFWSYAALQIPAGWWIDRLGPRRLIAAAAVGWGAFQTLAAAATGGTFLLLTRLGLGAMEAPLFPAGAKLNALWLSSRERARGAVLMDSGSPLGAAVGGALISALMVYLGSWRMAFACAGVATVLLGYVAWRYLRDEPATHPAVGPAELALIRSAAARDAGTIGVAPAGLSPRTLAAILVGRMSWAMINFGLLTWGPSYLAQARGFDLKRMGGATFAIFLAGAVGSLSAGFVVDRLQSWGAPRGMSYKGALGLTGLGVLAAFVVLPTVSDPWAAVAVLAATVFCLYWGSLYWSLPVILAPRDKVGLVGGTMNFAGSSSGIAIPLITGFILQWSGNDYLYVLRFFVGCAAVYVVATLLIDFRGTEGR
jgi:MFS transporter, ACS family, D-galactonate transporter